MRIYSATLTRDIEAQCTFESTDCMTGNKLPEYQVPMKLTKGERHFRELRRCKAWVDIMNHDYGHGTAIFNGKVKG